MSDVQKFDKHFEEKLIQSMMVDSLFAEQMMDVLELKYLDLSYTTRIARLLSEYYRKYEVMPSVNLIEGILNNEEKDEALLTQCLGFLSQTKKKTDFNDLEYVKDKSLQFFRVKNLLNVLDQEIMPKLERAEEGGEDLLEEILPIIQRAVSKGTERNVGYDYMNDENARFLEENFGKVPTPWEYFNEMLGGGWGNGRLITAIGSSGAGKSHVCVNVGVGGLQTPKEDGSGRVVVHYTLELSDLEVARRYDARLVGVEIDDVPNSKEKILRTLKTNLPPGAKLIIKAYPMKSASITTIKNHLAQLKIQGVVPDMIVIDYGDLLKPCTDNKERRHNLESIWIDMKSLAQTMNIPVFTVTQTNRGGYNSDIITPDQVSEDFSKIMHSDIIFTIARNMEQKILGIGKVYVAKNRQGKDGQILCYRIDTGKCYVDILEMNEEIEAEIQTAEMNAEKSKQQSVASQLRARLAKKE